MVVNYQIESTPLSSIIANLNPFATLPTTSKGAGEIIHYTGDNTIRWNSQTVNPTTNPTWSDLSAGGVTDHGALTGLTDDDHTQYLPTSASRALTGDLYINKTTPHIVFQESSVLRGSLYIESDDSLVIDAAVDDLTLASASDNINLFPAGTVQAKFTPTSFVSYQDVVCDKTTLPGFVLYEGAAYRGGIYINSDDDTVVDCEHGDVILGTYVSTGGLIKFQPLNAGNAFTISSTALTSTVALAMGGNAISNAAIPGTNNISFIIDQDNAGAGVSSSLRFNRGSSGGDAAIWWDEGDDEFQFDSDVGVTVGNIRVANIGATKVVTGDHGAAATDEVVNVCYGTSATPPAANTTTEGALYIQYTA